MGKQTENVCISKVVTVLVGLLASFYLAEGMDLDEQCVHYESEHCPPLPEGDCRTMERPDGSNALLCCNIPKSFSMKERVASILPAEKNITALHIRNISLGETLDITFLSNHSLVSLAITDSGNLTRLTGQLGLDSLACLNLSSNSLTAIEPSMLLKVRTLEFLDLSNNSLSKLPNMPETSSTLGVDMFNNDNVVCHHVREKMAQKNLKFLRRGETKCSAERYYSWFNSTHHLLLTALELIDNLEQTCPRGKDYNCTCKFSRIITMENQLNQLSQFLVEVDCSHLNLTKLPDVLPNNTEIVNITNNHVTSLAPLVNNPAYKDVRFLIADNNNISSILDLEGSNFIKSFRIFALKSNNLKTLPTYILSNSFDRVSEKKLNLGLNKFDCDCTTAQDVKMWLVANSKYIPDANEILCEAGGRVIDLDRSDVCATQRNWTDYIYYIIAGQVVLLAFLVGKFLYDYWVFKSTGYLPWIASKMPKMPCDWVFET